LKGHTRGVHAVAYSPDGLRLASGSQDNTLKVWDAGSGQDLLTLEGHTDWVSDVAYSPDGSRIASGSSDRTLKVWDAANGRLLATFPSLDTPLAISHHPMRPIFHVADCGAATGVPYVYVLELVFPSPPGSHP